MALLAIDRAPAAALPLGYLRFVPVWGVLAAGLLFYLGPTTWASRWAPGTIALTHAFVLGVLGNAILGSLLQFLPVVARARPWAADRLGGFLPIIFNTGILALICGLLHWSALVAAAGVTLVLCLALYVLSALVGLFSAGQWTLLSNGLALALLGLLVTASLGFLLTLGWSGWVVVPMMQVTDVHAAVGLFGSILLLVGVVGSVILPMFQGTAVLPSRLLTAWIITLVTALTLSITLRLRENIGGDSMAAILALPAAVFASAILVLQWRAPHRRNPSLVGFWRLGAIALLAAAAVGLAANFWPQAGNTPLAGVLAIGIGMPSLVLGMQLEIVAFLAWIALQSARPRGMRVPTVDALLTEQSKSRLLSLHWLASLGLVLAVTWPSAVATRLTALALAMFYALYGYEMRCTHQRVRRIREYMSNYQ